MTHTKDSVCVNKSVTRDVCALGSVLPEGSLDAHASILPEAFLPKARSFASRRLSSNRARRLDPGLR